MARQTPEEFASTYFDMALYVDQETKFKRLVALVTARDAEIAEEAAIREREKVARWMIGHSLVTGHGDTIEDLLTEAWSQIATLRPVRP